MARVSIIIPAWCTEQFVGQAIASARAQTMPDLEIIVVNDYSLDDTAGAVRRAADGDPRVILIEHNKNQGPAGARNTALAAAKGEWIAVLDADDEMAPDRLEKLLAHAARTNADIVADDLLLVNQSLPGASSERLLFLETAQSVTLAAYARTNRMFTRARQTGYLKPMFRAAFLARHALRYDPLVRIGEDYMLVAHALALGAQYQLIPDALYHYNVRDGSISRTLTTEALAALIEADDRFQTRFGASFDAPTRAAVTGRRANLEDAAAFVASVEALKQRNVTGALTAALRRPASLRHFAMPIGARVARIFQTSPRGAA